ncbi:hypothetical protein Tco_1295706, partial [Tanacetum coccineum]
MYEEISTSKEYVHSSLDIVYSKGPSNSLLNWYEVIALPNATRSSSKAKASGSKAITSPKTLIIKSHVPIKNCVLRLANAKTWDAILSKTFGVKIPPTMTCAEDKKGKRKIIEIIILSSNSSNYSKGVPKEEPCNTPKI